MQFTTLTVSPDADEVKVADLYDRTHLVAPVVMVVEGVLKDGYVPGEEISYSAHGGNGRPITAPPEPETDAYTILPDDLPDGMSGHPLDAEGQFVSANQDPYASDMRIGEVRNVGFEDDGAKLTGEAWLDIDRVKSVGTYAEQVVQALVDGEPLDVSIGFWHDIEEQAGAFNETEYEYVVRNIMPDHLAMLPNETGECSWGDGCGVPRAASATALAEIESVAGVECGDGRSMTAANDFDHDLDDEDMTFLRRLREIFRPEVNDSAESTMTPDIDIEALSEATGVAQDTLEGLEEDDLLAFQESVEPEADDDDDDPEATGDGGDGDDGGVEAEAIEQLSERIEELEQTIEEQRTADLSEEVELIAESTDYDKETIETWPEDAVTAMAAEVGTDQTFGGHGVNRLGQVGAATEDEDPAEDIGAVGALQGLSERDGGD